jgi:L-asparaginase
MTVMTKEIDAVNSQGNGDVLIIYTGGTIGSRPRDPDDPESPQFVVPWEEVESGMEDVGRLRSKRGWRIDCVPSREALDSCNIGPSQWLEYARIIEQNYARYNGFVILHGTDTMVYTASALSFMLRGLGKPVVLTGAQRSQLVDMRNDASQNLVTAIEIANATRTGLKVPPDVMIYFGGFLLRGNRSVKRATSGYSAYESPNLEPLGLAGDAIVLRPLVSRPQVPFQLRPKLEPKVLPVFIFPGITADVVQRQIEAIDGLKAVIVQAYGSGNIPTLDPAFIEVFSRARKQGILVAVVTQCRNGPVELGIYETSAQLLEAGFVAAYDITIEAAQCKLMSLLGDPDITLQEAEAEFMRSLSGEQSVSVDVTDLASDRGEIKVPANGPFGRHRIPARPLAGQWDSAHVGRALLRLRQARVSCDTEENSKSLVRVFLDLDPDAVPSDDHVGFAGAYNKWHMDNDGLVMFDVTERVRQMTRPGQRVSFTIVLDTPEATLSWGRADLAIFADERGT